jgi:hypothetical protein
MTDDRNTHGVDVLVQVQAGSDEDADELMEAAARLRAELLELDVNRVEPVSEAEAPEQAKGLAAIAGWLAVQFGSLEGLRAVVDVVRGWATRTNRQVEISYGDDVLKLTGATSAQQDKIIDAWIARHTPGP